MTDPRNASSWIRISLTSLKRISHSCTENAPGIIKTSAARVTFRLNSSEKYKEILFNVLLKENPASSTHHKTFGCETQRCERYPLLAGGRFRCLGRTPSPGTPRGPCDRSHRCCSSPWSVLGSASYSRTAWSWWADAWLERLAGCWGFSLPSECCNDRLVSTRVKENN